MHIPIPDGRAEECARDLANDCRTLASHALKEQGEALELLRNQIQSLADIVCVDVISGETFRVGDYVTARREMLANARKFSLFNAYQKLTKWLH